MIGCNAALQRAIGCAWLSGLLLASGPAMAEPGITDGKIVIGQTAGFTGPAGEQVQEMTQGARLYLDAVNRAGGVNGRKIELISEDDGFDAAASKNTHMRCWSTNRSSPSSCRAARQTPKRS